MLTSAFIQSIFHEKKAANIVLGSGSVIGRLLPFVSGTQNGPNGKISPPSLNPLQEARLKYLKQRLAVPFDSSSFEHQALKEKSTIIQILKQENEGLVQYTATDEDSTNSGGSNILKSWAILA
ncbi:unnamed protein product [Fraxinus pennsylvanica]|uniref:Uncharacterized protein n=1 Tax=Fraxinus pennsylvanica TaxID=56036 RepID=A0AAD2DUP8_9LAMI|nr:unnamed protein product [Fraxinus pennsylvanica]